MKAKVYFLLAAVLAAALPGRLRAESLTITTTYPPPSAIYNQVTTTGEPNTDTTLNRNGGNTILVPPSNPNGNVGVGTKTPAKKLDVNGDAGVSGTFTAVGDIKVGADSVFTGFSCSGGITCSRAGNNTLRIDLALAANPVNCVGNWSGCSNGNQTYIITTPASGGGAACPYSSGQLQSCAQPVNCVGSWGACSKTCGGGSQTYTINTPASGGGGACPYQSGQTQACNTQACVTNGTCTGSCVSAGYSYNNPGCPATKTGYCTARGPVGGNASCGVPQGFYNMPQLCGYFGCTVTCTPR